MRLPRLILFILFFKLFFSSLSLSGQCLDSSLSPDFVFGCGETVVKIYISDGTFAPAGCIIACIDGVNAFNIISTASGYAISEFCFATGSAPPFTVAIAKQLLDDRYGVSCFEIMGSCSDPDFVFTCDTDIISVTLGDGLSGPPGCYTGCVNGEYTFILTDFGTGYGYSQVQGGFAFCLGGNGALTAGQIEDLIEGSGFHSDCSMNQNCNLTVAIDRATVYCKNQEEMISATVQNSIGTVTYSWSGPNGFVSTDANPTVSNFISGSYQVTITDELCSKSTSRELVGIDPPTAGTPNSPLEVCTGISITQNIPLKNLLLLETSGGIWSRLSGTGGTLDPIGGIFGVSATTTTSAFKYTVTNSCGTASEEVTIDIIDCGVTIESQNRLRFRDPCSCTDPRNCDFGGDILFHDTLTVDAGGVSGLTITIAPGATDFYTAVPCFSGVALPQVVPAGTIVPEVPAGSGIYKLEFWRPGGIVPSISAIESGITTAAPASTFLPLCDCEDIVPIPTMGQWGIICLALLLLIFGVNSILQRDVLVEC